MALRCLVPLLCLNVAVAVGAQSRQPDAPATAPITWIFFIDDLHLDFRNTGRIRNMLRKIAAELLVNGDQFAIASSGPSKLALDATADREMLDAAIRRVTGNALRYEDIRSARSSAEVRYRALTSMSTTHSRLELASQLPGAKAMLFVSNGHGYTAPDMLDALANVTSAAGASNVRIFTIDPGAAFEDLDPIVPDPAFNEYLAAAQNSLRAIAEPTGGFAIVREFVPQLRRITDVMGR